MKHSLPYAMVAALLFLTAGFSPPTALAADLPQATITKALDSTQGAGFTMPNSFQTGSLVRYRLAFQCSSLTVACDTAAITDVLDLNLDFVQVIPPVSGITTATSNWDQATHTLTTSLANLAAGATGEIILIAKVNARPATGVIPNSAQIQVAKQPPVITPPVTIVVPAGTARWQLSKIKTLPVGNPAPNSIVTYSLNLQPQSGGLGNVGVTRAQLVDSFPVGAVIDNAAGGTVNYPTHTITWTVGPLTATGSWSMKIQLHYPSTPRVAGEPAFSACDVPVNSLQDSNIYDDGSTGTLTAQAPVSLVAPAPAIRVGKVGPTQVFPGGLISWQANANNTGNVPLSNPILTDSPLPVGVNNFYLYYDNADNLPNYDTDYYDLVGGTWVKFATHLLSDSYPWGPFSLASTASGVRAVPRLTSAPIGAKYAAFKLWGTVTGAAGSMITNCAQGTSDPAVTGTVCANSAAIKPAVNNVSIIKRHTFTDSGAAAVKPGTVFDWQFAVAGNQNTGTTSQFTLSDTLPVGFTYLGIDCVGTNSHGLSQAVQSDCGGLSSLKNAADFPAPTLTTHADGTTGISWNIDLTNRHFGQSQLRNDYALVIKLRIQVNNGAAIGSYKNSAAIQTPGPIVCNVGTLGTDPYDYNGDGSTTDASCNATDNVEIAAAAIINSSKWSKGAANLANVSQSDGLPSTSCPDLLGYTRYPCVAQTTPSGPFSYQFQLQNIGNVPVTDYIMYDDLPTPGDTGVSQLLSGQSRGSQWTPSLTGPVTVLTAPTGANPMIQYNRTSNPCRPELNQGASDDSWQLSCDDNWYSAAQITDWSTVHSFRIKAFQPAGATTPEWVPLAKFVIQAVLLAPKDAPTSTMTPLNLSVAWNSFAHREYRLNPDGSTARLLAAEPQEVGVIIPFVPIDRFAIGDYVWTDTNRNGVQDAGEPPIAGVIVTLKNAAGNVVGTTTTDINGVYHFDQLAAGSYTEGYS